MFLQNFWSDWIELDLINCVTTIYIWISPPFFDVSRRDLAIKEIVWKILWSTEISTRCYIYVVALFITEEVSKLQKW